MVRKYEAESLDNKTYAVKTVDNSGQCSGGKFVGQLGIINYLRFQKIEVADAGTYAMTVFYMATKSMLIEFSIWMENFLNQERI